MSARLLRGSMTVRSVQCSYNISAEPLVAPGDRKSSEPGENEKKAITEEVMFNWTPLQQNSPRMDGYW